MLTSYSYANLCIILISSGLTLFLTDSMLRKIYLEPYLVNQGRLNKMYDVTHENKPPLSKTGKNKCFQWASDAWIKELTKLTTRKPPNWTHYKRKKEKKKKRKKKEKERKLGLFQISRLANQPFDCRGESQFPKTPSVIVK